MSHLESWLALSFADNLGCYTIKKLLTHFANAENIINADANLLKRFKLNPQTIRALRNPNQQLIQQACQWASQNNHHIMTLADADYPYLLKQVPDPPPILYIIGNSQLLKQPQLAMVGSRNPSPIGLELAYQFAAELVKTGLVITSGMALGIDGASHRGALAAQGQTIAILGNGLNSIYPKRHQRLADEIMSNGALVSEFPLDMPPYRDHFPRRNRIICGLSMGTLVVEAALRSGSLITARLASEYNREVFALPGAINNPLARGCHYLIQNGAKLIESTQDILTEITQFAPLYNDLVDDKENPAQDKAYLGLTQAEIQLLGCIGYEATTIDQTIARSGLTAHTVTAMLLNLELNGYICAAPGGYIKK